MSLEDRLRGGDRSGARARGGLPGRRGWSAYMELTKPGITFYVAVTAAAGYVLAALPEVSPALLLHIVGGTLLSTAGALALNQYLEHAHDALMVRTRQRPVPSGRIPPVRARLFGWVLLLAGAGHLWYWCGWLPAALAAAAALLYNGAYTPLKLRSPLATLVGAVPGALPVLIGWTAHAGAPVPPGLALFGILFLWQIVHVLALAWSLREDYARAGFRLIPEGSPRLAGALMLGYSTALVPASVLPVALNTTRMPYSLAALALGSALVAASAAFWRAPTPLRCRRVFLGSLAYHPLLLGSMVVAAL